MADRREGRFANEAASRTRINRHGAVRITAAVSDVDPEICRPQDPRDTMPSEWKDMNVAELDGHAVNLIVRRDTVPPDERLPGVWSPNIGLEDAEWMESTIASAMEHCGRVARELAERRRTVRQSREWTRTAARRCGSRVEADRGLAVRAERTNRRTAQGHAQTNGELRCSFPFYCSRIRKRPPGITSGDINSMSCTCR